MSHVIEILGATGIFSVLGCLILAILGLLVGALKQAGELDAVRLELRFIKDRLDAINRQLGDPPLNFDPEPFAEGFSDGLPVHPTFGTVVFDIRGNRVYPTNEGPLIHWPTTNWAGFDQVDATEGDFLDEQYPEDNVAGFTMPVDSAYGDPDLAWEEEAYTDPDEDSADQHWIEDDLGREHYTGGSAL